MAIKNFLILIAFNFYFPLCDVDVGSLSSTIQLDCTGVVGAVVCWVGTWGASAHTHTLIWHTTFSYSRIPQASCTKIFAQLAIENWKTFSYICFGFIQLTVAARAPSYTHTQAHTRIHRHTRPTRGHSQRLLTYKQIHILATTAAISKVLYALL